MRTRVPGRRGVRRARATASRSAARREESQPPRDTRRAPPPRPPRPRPSRRDPFPARRSPSSRTSPTPTSRMFQTPPTRRRRRARRRRPPTRRRGRRPRRRPRVGAPRISPRVRRERRGDVRDGGDRVRGEILVPGRRRRSKACPPAGAAPTTRGARSRRLQQTTQRNERSFRRESPPTPPPPPRWSPRARRRAHLFSARVEAERGVTATRAASSHKDEGKPSGKHANAPNNASNACAQDARRGTFSRGFEPELASALADGERRWARVLDRRGASGPSDAGDDAGDGEGRSPAATAESAPSASRHTSAAIVEPTEEGADPRKQGCRPIRRNPRGCANRRPGGGFRARVDSHLAERGGGGARRASVGDESEISRETNHLNRQRRGCRG